MQNSLNNASEKFKHLSQELPVIGILRGVVPENVIAVAEVLVAAGIKMIEVPTNSPQVFKSIALLAKHFNSQLLLGAGTVTNLEQLAQLQAVGGELLVSPNTNPNIIAAAVEANIFVLPGVATATDAFAAIEAGATAIKLFPASTYGPSHVKALTAVLPAHINIYAVGGVGANNYREWAQAGIAGVGVGSELFKPEYSLEDIHNKALALVASIKY